MPVEFKGIESVALQSSEIGAEENRIELHEKPQPSEEILQTIDQMIASYIHFANKDNEGQQALIFKYDLETNISTFSEEDREAIENYIGETKSIKILKITNRKAATSEFEWHNKAYNLYEAIPDEEKHKYAGIPKPYIHHTIDIDEETRKRLNRQNASLSEDEVSVMVMEWINGEDLLAKTFRKYLAGRPAYADMAKNPLVGFQSLLISVSGDFQTNGLIFSEMSVLEQYTKLFKAISKRDQILSSKQQEQIKNTLDLLHKHKIFHNDLHLRNYLIEDETDKVFIIDFGRTANKEKLFENDIKDSLVLNFAKEYSKDDDHSEAIIKALDRDIERIVARDRSFAEILSSVKAKEGSDLMRVLEYESAGWRLDSWNMKKMVAVVRSLEKTDQAKAQLIKEFIRNKVKQNNFSVEIKQVAEVI